MDYINLAPHTIKLNDGRSFPASGTIVRVNVAYTPIVDDIATQVYGDVQDIPAPKDGVRYIVSALVLARTTRKDVVAPATGHPDTQRNDKGHIVSVPCFTQ